MRLPIVALLCIPWCATLVATQGVVAQVDAARDSVRALRAARSEQNRFERVRRDNLPWAWGGGSSGRCDEWIGRFCLTYGDEDTEWHAPPEPEPVDRARARLIERLDSAAATIPGDGWVAGQRVRYLVEARRFAEARAAAAACRAAAWWCGALAGYASHYAGDAAAADAAFSAALAAMPARERREWTDLSDILDGCAVRHYRRLRGAPRDDFETRFWRLADPFLTRPGNAIRSEHLARNVMDALQDRAESTENIRWAGDLREILVRYGWPTGWERIRPPTSLQQSPGMVSHYGGTDQKLLPPCGLLTGRTPLPAAVWDVDDPRARAGYALPLGDSLARWIHPLDHVISLFRRADSTVVVAAYSLPADSVRPGTPVRAGLALLPERATTPIVALADGGGLEGSLRASFAAGPALLSLELIAERDRRVARAREGLEPARLAGDSLVLSDLLLLRDSPSLPEALDAAVPLARGSDRVRPGEQFGAYWEVYGLPAAASQLTLSLRLLDEHRSVVRRLAERLGVARAANPVNLTWRESAAPVDGIAPRALLVAVPPETAPGRYTLELTVTAADGAEAVARRVLEVERPRERSARRPGP